LFGGNEPHGLLLIDIIRRLPKELFESIAIGLGNKPPSESFLDAVSGNYFSVGYNEEYAKNLLSSQEFDCIVFAENLNDGTMHFLAYNRFAPVQILVMGAPVTSSIPTIDYFISGDRLEHVSHFNVKASID
jgi:predicted O-linked N-acetylglucosamine transferase (SPINDLY family)